MIYKKHKLLFQLNAFYLIFLGLLSCGEKQETVPTNLTKAGLIPYPASIEATGGSFIFNEKTQIYINKGNNQIGNHLSEMLKPATGFDFDVQVMREESVPSGNIILALSSGDDDLGEEGYSLEITADKVEIKASKETGLFYGIQTLLQLLPAEIDLKSKQEIAWTIPTGKIKDQPNYTFRGSMLDVARHFFGVEDIKRYIDFLAYYKMNVLHLGLSNDQGWRIEIKSWPKLATYGGSTQVGGGEGGYYTQEQYKEIVAYAADRFIMIIPEIDMPGHTNAALASYPELNCDGKSPELYTGTDVGFSTLCTDKEVVYQFIDDVIKELSVLTPGAYIHIGGDESKVTAPEDFKPFITRVQGIVKKHGKQMIGWEEVVQAELEDDAIIQYWTNPEHALKTVEKGLKMIMSPAHKTYLDMQYDSTTRLGLHWAAYIEVDSAYIWAPETMVPGIQKENILGIEAPLWTETIETMDDIEYMAFPRLPGYAEIAWTPTEIRDWDTYKKRLAAHGARFKAKEIDYYPSKLIAW